MTTDTVAEAAKIVKTMHLHANVDSSNEQKWGFELPQLYQLAVKFYKEKEGKAIHLSYASRLQFVGLSQQVSHGSCRPDSLRPLGVLDMVGRDRREAWQQLGELSRADAMIRYIEMLDTACPIFRPFAEAHKRDLEAQKRRREEERVAEEQRQQRQLVEERERRQREQERSRQAETKRHIQDALNRQTYPQFRIYAAQQYPGNPEQQAVLIRKLQQQHYQQYMQQLFQHQHQHQQQQQQQPTTSVQPVMALDSDSKAAGNSSTAQHSAENATEVPRPPKAPVAETPDSGNQSKDGDPAALAAARMWTHSDLAQFKAAMRAERGSAVVTVGQGQMVTVRIPAREDGTCLFWEFATDSCDLGFGVSFEWGPTTQYEVTIEVSNGSEEDEGGDERETDGEEGRAVSEPSVSRGPSQTSCVVPVYRRDCHQQVYAGSHRFPAHEGVYLLKFDNSYSLWRAKTLYYRVFYTR